MASGNSIPASNEIPKPPTADGLNFEQNLRRLDQMANLGLIAASVAHEIKNGMVAINTFVELLLQKNAGEDKELSETVRRELKRIDALVTQMLRLAAPSSAATATVRVHDLLDHTLRLLQHQMSGKLIALHRHYAAAPDTVRGDEAQLQQAFMNLLLNAVEAIGSNGELNVATEIVSNGGARRLQIQIKDFGMGIAPETLPHLFEAFFTTKKNGTGLGLAICHRVIREHGGEISAHSEPDKGATFNILLPVSE